MQPWAGSLLNNGLNWKGLERGLPTQHAFYLLSCTAYKRTKGCKHLYSINESKKWLIQRYTSIKKAKIYSSL